MTLENKMKVLLVDDDKFLLDMYSLKFKKAEIDIYTCSNSTQALEKIKSDKDLNVILLDIIMPGIDGMEMLKKIKEENLAPNAKIIMLTNQAEEMAKAKELGVSGYIVKATTIPSEVVEKVISIYKNN